jgi:SAM-dependent MidA family methyltransferase
VTPRQRPPEGERSAELAAVIRAAIESSPQRRLTFARFMELALYEPSLGYYRQDADRPTDAGDFLTAPETHPIFGWTIARRIEAMWAELGRPRLFHLVEYGAGSGTLGLAVLDGLRRHAEGLAAGGPGIEGAASPGDAGELLAAILYEPVETNRHRLADLRKRFAKAGLEDRLAAGDEAVPVTGVLIANEFLDALPVHRIVIRGGRVRELFVAWSGRLVEVEDDPSTPDLERRLADDGLSADQLAEGQIAEISLGLDPWLRGAAARLGRGCALIVDYGYPAAELYGPRHLAGTLLGYRGHRVVDDPFDSPGLTDLTAHVDFTALQFLAGRHGFRTRSLETQQEFLVAAGLEAELQALQASPETDIQDYLRARSGIVRMLDPRHMGHFRVLTLDRS